MLEGRRDGGRDAVMYTAVRHGRERLPEVARGMDGLKYPADARAVRRFGEPLEGILNIKSFVASLG